MKEHFFMLLMFMASIYLLGWFFGVTLISWIIVGRAAFLKKGISLANDGLVSYWFYIAWPFYLNKQNNNS